jgi:hypothetical protein
LRETGGDAQALNGAELFKAAAGFRVFGDDFVDGLRSRRSGQE